MDFTQAQHVSDRSSLKLVKSGAGTVTTSAFGGAGSTQSTATIPHGLGTDELIFQVGVKWDGQYYMAPFQSPGGQVLVYPSLDGTNLYVTAETNSAGGGQPQTTFEYYYRLLVP